MKNSLNQFGSTVFFIFIGFVLTPSIFPQDSEFLPDNIVFGMSKAELLSKISVKPKKKESTESKVFYETSFEKKLSLNISYFFENDSLNKIILTAVVSNMMPEWAISNYRTGSKKLFDFFMEKYGTPFYVGQNEDKTLERIEWESENYSIRFEQLVEGGNAYLIVRFQPHTEK